MILETQEEKDAFDYVWELASEITDRRGCNDLTQEEITKFKNLQIETTEMPSGKVYLRPATMDFDIVWWLKKQVKQ